MIKRFSQNAAPSLLRALKGHVWHLEIVSQIEKITLVLLFLSLNCSVLGTSPSLKITISLMESSFFIDEPLVIKLTLLNSGNTNIRIATSLDKGGGVIDYKLKNAEGSVIGYNSPIIKDYHYGNFYTGQLLKPGEKFSLTEDLTYQMINEKEKFTLNKSGVYFISTSYRWNRNPDAILITALSSNSPEIKLIVKDPSGVDAQVYELLKKAPIPRFSNLNEQIKYFSPIIKRFPKSRYTKYAHVKLAEAMEMKAWQSKSSMDFKIVIAEWRTIVNSYKFFAYTNYAKQRIALDLFKSGDKSTAVREYNKLRKDPLLTDMDKFTIDATLQSINAGRMR